MKPDLTAADHVSVVGSTNSDNDVSYCLRVQILCFCTYPQAFQMLVYSRKKEPALVHLKAFLEF